MPSRRLEGASARRPLRGNMATRGIRHAKCIDYIDKDVFYSIDKRLLEAAAKETGNDIEASVYRKLGRHQVYIKRHNERFPKKVVYWAYARAWSRGQCGKGKGFVRKDDKDFVCSMLSIDARKYERGRLDDESRLQTVCDALFALSSKKVDAPIDELTVSKLKELVDDIIDGREIPEDAVDVSNAVSMSEKWIDITVC